MSKQNPIGAATAQSIHNSRIPVEAAHVGQQTTAMVTSASFQTAEQQEESNPGQAKYFDKYIVNLKASSQEAVARKENRLLFREGLRLEAEGKTAEADEVFNKWLNATQLSFNVIANSDRHVFAKGDIVKFTIGTAETKAGHKALIVESPAYQAPVVIERKKFDITDLIGEEADEEISEGVNAEALSDSNVLS